MCCTDTFDPERTENNVERTSRQTSYSVELIQRFLHLFNVDRRQHDYCTYISVGTLVNSCVREGEYRSCALSLHTRVLPDDSSLRSSSISFVSRFREWRIHRCPAYDAARRNSARSMTSAPASNPTSFARLAGGSGSSVSRVFYRRNVARVFLFTAIRSRAGQMIVDTTFCLCEGRELQFAPSESNGRAR